MNSKNERPRECGQADNRTAMTFESARPRLKGKEIFLSASIPDSSRWPTPFDPLEITSASLAAAQAILLHGGRICYGGHPAISPLIIRVAAAIFAEEPPYPPMITVYQSELYEDRTPQATRELAEQGLGKIVRVPAALGEMPEAGRNTESLEKMRRWMLDPSRHQYAAGLFIGGMEGIIREASLFHELHPRAPVYVFGGPGGAAAQLASEQYSGHMTSPLHIELVTSRDYGTLMDDIIADLQERHDDPWPPRTG